MCEGKGGGGLGRIPGPTGNPGWGSPAWPPSRRKFSALWLTLTWPLRLAEHEPSCRWRRFVYAALRIS